MYTFICNCMYISTSYYRVLVQELRVFRPQNAPNSVPCNLSATAHNWWNHGPQHPRTVRELWSRVPQGPRMKTRALSRGPFLFVPLLDRSPLAPAPRKYIASARYGVAAPAVRPVHDHTSSSGPLRVQQLPGGSPTPAQQVGAPPRGAPPSPTNKQPVPHPEV